MSLETPSQYEKGVEDGMRMGAIDERKRIAAWLREGGPWDKPMPLIIEDAYWHAAMYIEAGEHLK